MWTRMRWLAGFVLLAALLGATPLARLAFGQAADAQYAEQAQLRDSQASLNAERLASRRSPRGPRTATRGPWPARHRTGVRVASDTFGWDLPADPGALSPRRLRALGMRGGPRTQIAIESWPKEPGSPAQVDPDAFARALHTLCPEQVPAQTVARVARAALSAAHAHGVDPFTLAALAYHQSGCAPRSHDSYGLGLTRINLGMHAAHVRDGLYHYRQPLRGGGFARASLPLGGHAFATLALLEPEANLYFAALFLRVFEAQCPAIDAAFHSAPHRHPISHLVFGDHVRSALPESMILTVRRRLLAYYRTRDARVCTSCNRVAADASVALSSPLDGPPRIVTGVIGDPRDRGARLHAGIDLMAIEGEPVRAVEAGVVINAGVELRDRRLFDLLPERASSVPHARMGPRGLFVRVEHAHGLVSLYSHFARYLVRVGERVDRGQVIGYVGRSGVHTSDAHLHFGLFERDRVLDPLVSLDPYLLAVERGMLLDFDLIHERLRRARRRP